MHNQYEHMADTFTIHGGKKLHGTIPVRGAKNAAFAILAAALLTEETCEIDNLPLVEDILVMLEIIKSVGVQCEFIGERKVRITAATVSAKDIRNDIVEKIRASILLCGSLSMRTKKFKLAKPGGCSIGARVLGPHIDALAHLGVSMRKAGKFIAIEHKETVGDKEIVLSEMSVTATTNTVLAAVLRKGTTTIYCAAAEPYVQDACHFLTRMGANISGIGTNVLVIRGVARLHGADHFIMPDPIEIGTFITLAACTKSRIKILDAVPEFMRADLLKFEQAGVIVRAKKARKSATRHWYTMQDIEVIPAPLVAVQKIHNMPYPGVCPDMLPLFAVLMTQAKGVSLIHDWMYEGRLRYIDELKRMGADAFICDPHRALITGPTPLEGKNITSFDLRAGAVLIIGALTAKGKTTIANVYQIDRGYEKIEERLRKIGADITRVSV